MNFLRVFRLLSQNNKFIPRACVEINKVIHLSEQRVKLIDINEKSES